MKRSREEAWVAPRDVHFRARGSDLLYRKDMSANMTDWEGALRAMDCRHFDQLVAHRFAFQVVSRTVFVERAVVKWFGCEPIRMEQKSLEV